MKKIGGIHTFEDQSFLKHMTKASLAVLAGGVIVAIAWYFAVSALGQALGVPVVPLELPTALGGLGARLLGDAEYTGMPNLFWWLSLAAVTVLSLVVHELVHGFFFRQFAPPGSRVTFGANLNMGMLYASAEDIVYTRQQYLVIALSPSLVVTLILMAIGVGLKWPLWTIAVATLHLSGCTGDWGYVRAILRDPSISHCEDTSWGVCFYGAGDVPAPGPAVLFDEASAGADGQGHAAAASTAAARGFSVVSGGKSSDDANSSASGSSGEPRS